MSSMGSQSQITTEQAHTKGDADKAQVRLGQEN